ncbi:zinc transporter ZIP2 isoform X2 [Moschus berezovskii]|uniref:zinc transporter ZIP2 isoform X2 n=1 Tax=Moschus berezovskii TaxID=68408 RepID=UPI00244377C9|nr:zinc transporter ZIP2 isoform X2 [Moschus berezovskii]
MELLLGAKIGCLLALFVLTLICGLIPICFKWFQTATATGRHRRVLSFLGCMSAGVFLGAGFMHMTAEALEGIKSEIQNLVIQNGTKSEGHSDDAADSAYGSAVKKPPSTQETRVRSPGGEEPLEKEMAPHSSILAWKIPWNLAGYSPEDRKELDTTEHKHSTLSHLTTPLSVPTQMEYPYGELVISLGFFLVFLLESLALQCCAGAAETPKVQEQELGTAHELEPHSHGLLPSPSRGPFRALVLLLSLSFHSVFEGLAVGLQLTVASTVQLCLAVLAHKGIVVFGVGLRLVQLCCAVLHFSGLPRKCLVRRWWSGKREG